MAFDPMKHKINIILIRCGEQLFPGETNITTLAEMTGKLLGVEPEKMTSIETDHLPKPSETGPFFPCPKCGNKTLLVFGLCPTCKDSEGGKYAAKLQCQDCKYEEKTTKHIVTILTEFGYDFKNQTKAELGIKTITDNGVK